MDKLKAAERAIEIADGPTSLAAKLGKDFTPQRVNNWRYRGVPAGVAQDIELITNGGVKAYELCPDTFRAPDRVA